MVVTVGVCCMDVKLYSRPMGAILNRLRRYDDITIVPFGNRCIFDKPVELWPIVDFLICFYSAGFPLDKAQEYVRLRDPLCFNNVLTQHLLLDRTVVYKMLRANGIPVPRYRVLRRTPTGAPVSPAAEDCVAVSPAFTPVPDLAPPAPPTPPTPPTPPSLHNSSSSSSSSSSSGPAPVVPLVPSSVPPDPPSASSAPGSPIKPQSSSTSTPSSSSSSSLSSSAGTTAGGETPMVDPITASQTQGKRLSGAGPAAAWSTQAADFARYKQMLLELQNDDAADEAVMRGTGPGAVDPETIDAQRRAAYWGAGDPIEENEDSICVGGERFKKPFVEKPVWAEDHNIYVYYPKSSGGGSKRLFRKVRDRSSKFFPSVSTVRRDGSFIYEDFITTDGMDVKVYTIGPDYAHAEARKAPTVDGRVMRTEDGKEVRYHVILNQAEKEIARKITQIFGQNICGFDLLRTDTMSYVCDVNGFSFVKGSAKYYNDCAQIIYEMIQFHLHPVPMGISRASRLVQDNDERLETPQPADTRRRELRCLLAVIRHGDRTPKQKVKVKTAHPLILAFFAGRDPKKQVKFKSVKELQEFSAAITQIVSEMDSTTNGIATSGTTAKKENPHKALLEIKEALEETSHFSGINRKVQIKPLKWVFEEGDDTRERVAQALLIFKYGGQLTDFGFRQADWLGKTFRQTMYPADSRGGLSLHSSFAHDIKFYASDEGRVQMTAAMFAKAFLELDEEEIIPILYALVWNDDRAISWLDCSISSSSTFVNEKRRVAEVVNADVDFGEHNHSLDPTLLFGGTTVEELRRLGAGALGNPRRQLERVRASIGRLLAELEPRCRPLQGQQQDTQQEAQQEEEEEHLSRAEPPCTPDDLLLAGGAGACAAVAEGCDDATAEAAAAAAATLAPVAVPKRQQQQEQEHEREDGRLSCSPRSASKAVVQYDSQVARAVSVWRKLLRVFWSAADGRYDVSKVPDILDCALYHLLHFRTMSPRFREVYEAVYPLAAWVVPHEYGISQGSKNAIAEAVVRPLVNKLLADLRQPREQRQLQTVSRFYFTSESHLNTLCNLLEYRLGRPLPGPRYEEYISHFVVKMFENTWIPVNDPHRFVVEVHHSAGSNAANLPDPPGNMHTFVQPLRPYVTNMTLDDFIKALE